MRFSIILYFLLCASSYLAAQSAPAPTAPEIISEDDLKLGIYDAPAFQPAAHKLAGRPAEALAGDGELFFLIGPDSTAPRRIRYTPSYFRLQLACRQHAGMEDPLTFIFDMLEEQDTSRQEVAHQE